MKSAGTSETCAQEAMTYLECKCSGLVLSGSAEENREIHLSTFILLKLQSDFVKLNATFRGSQLLGQDLWIQLTGKCNRVNAQSDHL